jgi:hypothetical protein
MDEIEKFEREMRRLENAPLFSERGERLVRAAEVVLPYASLFMCGACAIMSTLLIKLGIDIMPRMTDLALMTWALALLFTCGSLFFKKQSGY